MATRTATRMISPTMHAGLPPEAHPAWHTEDGAGVIPGETGGVRVNKESVAKLDELVEGGLVGSRSEAAAFLIAEGIKARHGLFERIAEKISEIRSVRAQP